MLCEFKARLNGSRQDDSILVNVKRNAVSISVNTCTVYTFDLLGRLVTAVRNGHTYRRSLDNRMMEKWSISGRGQRRRVRTWLDQEAIERLVNQIHGQMMGLSHCIEQRAVVVEAGEEFENAHAGMVRALHKIIRHDYRKLAEDAGVFRSIYRPIGILPPDLYMTLVLQATAGCSYNRCDYCDFYKNQPFSAKSPDEFITHIRQVKEYFGTSLALRKSVFLGEANAFDLPIGKLLPLVDAVNAQFHFSPGDGRAGGTGQTFDGIYSFLSGFGRPKTESDFAELRARHVRRVYAGLESGSGEVLRLLNKPARVDNVVEMANRCRRAGIGAGVIILLGAGGRHLYSQHVDETVKAIRAMNLTKDDILYFSPLIPRAGSKYAQRLASREVEALSENEMELQKADMLAGFQLSPASRPKVALYDINEFIY